MIEKHKVCKHILKGKYKGTCNLKGQSASELLCLSCKKFVRRVSKNV